MAAMSPAMLMAWQPDGFTKVATTIGGQLKTANVVMATVSAVSQASQAFSGQTASAHSAQSQQMMQRLSQGISAANGLLGPLAETSLRLTQAKARMTATIAAATGLTPTPGPESPTGPWYVAPTVYQAGQAAMVNAQIGAIMAEVNATDHMGYVRMIGAVAAIVAAVAPHRSGSGGPNPAASGAAAGSGGTNAWGTTPSSGYAGLPTSTSLAGAGLGTDSVGDAVRPLTGAGVAATTAGRALAGAAAGGSTGSSAMGGLLGSPMGGAGAGRGEPERLAGTDWRITEDDDNIFASMPDPTGGALG
jgi:hypothetical protein